jgi:hypothetical protein
MLAFVHAEKLSFKKTVVASERDRPDVVRRRAQWTKGQSGIDPKRLVFIDETWTKTNMEPLRGWARRGERLVAKVPHGHWKTMTFVASLRYDRIEAPWFIDGPINGEGFRAYVEKVLVPTLRPDELVMMDNLDSHKGKAVRPGHSLSRRKAVLSPQVLAQSQSDRTGFRQAQAPSAQAGGAKPRGPRRRHRRTPRRLHRARVRQLLCQRRLRASLNSSRSSREGDRREGWQARQLRARRFGRQVGATVRSGVCRGLLERHH